MRNSVAWMALIALGVILIWTGATGRVGSVLAALITPTQLQDASSSN